MNQIKQLNLQNKTSRLLLDKSVPFFLLFLKSQNLNAAKTTDENTESLQQT